MMILRDTQRVDRLAAMRSELVAGYDHARRITDTRGMAAIAVVLRMVTHELMARQLKAQGLIK